MADNTTVINPSALNASGDVIRTIDVAGVKTQVVALGTYNPSGSVDLVQSSAFGGGYKSTSNSSTTPLTGGATFTGTVETNNSLDLMLSCKADQDGTLYVDFSNDGGASYPSTVSFAVAANSHEFHVLLKGPRSFRVRYVNGSAAQSSFDLSVYCGNFRQPNSPLNAVISQDADALITRSIGEEVAISRGLFAGYMVVNKFGRNSDIDTGSVPEDIWNGGGVYAGFPTGSPEEFQIVLSDAADIGGVITFTYLASSTATEYSTATVTTTGTSTNTGVTGWRMHTANWSSGSSTGFNAGTVTIRHRTTTSNIFCVMPIGRSQTNVAGYTVPAGSTAYVRRLFCRVIGATSGQVDGALWVRTLNGSPRLRRPFSASFSAPFEDHPYGGLAISAGSDIQVRISTASANNLDVIAGYDLVVVKN